MASGGIGGGNLGGVNPNNNSFAQPMTGADYNRRLQAGESSQTIRDSQRGGLFGGAGLSDNQFNDIVTQAGMQSPTGRPLAGSAQFYQPVYQSQYQNYNMGNPMGVSQYGQQPSFAGGFGGYGGGFMPQMQTPFQQPMQQPTMFGGQMQGGGYGQFGMNNPFSPYSNSFLNLDPNLSRGTQQQKGDAYRNAIQSGFGDQQIQNQITGLFGQQTPKDMGFLQGTAMGLTPGLGQGSEQDKVAFYQNARNQGFNDQTIRNAANQMIGNQSQGDWSYLQNRAGFGGGSGGFGNQFMPQMQSPFSFQPQFQPQMQTSFSRNNFIPDAPLSEGMVGTMGGMGFDPTTGRMDLGTAGGSGRFVSQPAAPRSSGPSQAIVGRSSQMRGTPNVMRRAQGGITNLLGKK